MPRDGVLARIVQHVPRPGVAVARLPAAAGIEDESRIAERDPVAVVDKVKLGPRAVPFRAPELYVRVADDAVACRLAVELRARLWRRLEIFPEGFAQAPVYQREISDLQRERKRVEPRAVLRRDGVARPERGARGHGVELFDAHLPGGCAIMIPRDAPYVVRAQRRDDAGGLCPVSDDVTAAPQSVETAPRFGVLENRC